MYKENSTLKETLEVEALRAELDDLKKTFNTILESSMAGYWDWNIPANEEYLSPTFKAMFGYEDHEVPNTPEWWQQNIHPEDLPKVMDTFRKHVETKGKYPYDNEVRYFHKDGSIVWVYCRGRVIEWDNEGNPIRMVGSHVDITPLKEARGFLEEALEISKAGLWEWDLSKGTLTLDKQIHLLYGIKSKKSEDDYKAWVNCLHKDDRERATQEVKNALRENKDYNTSYRAVWPNGEVRHIRAKGKVIFGENNKPYKMIGMSWDITKEQETLDALRDSEKRFQLATEGSSAGIWDWKDVNQEEVWWSPRVYEILGYEEGELPTERSAFRELLHPEDKKVGYEGLQKHYSGEKFEVEYRIKCKSGHYKWVRGNGQTQFDENGKPVRMVGTILDIDEKKKAEERLRESKEKFKLAVRGSGAGIWDWRIAAGNKEWWSPKFYALLGYKNNEIEAKLENFEKLLHPEDKERTFALVEKHFQKKTPFEIEYRLKTKSGEYKWFLGNGQAEWDENNNPIRMVGSIIDIDDKKKAETLASERTEQLKEKNKELEEFVFVASHDLQEPVRTISGFVDLFTDSYKDKLDDDGLQCLNFIKGATERSKDLVRDLLDYSRLGNQIKTTEIDLNKLLKDVKVDLFAKISEKGATIESGKLPTIKGLRTEMRLLFQNLIGNAIKFGKADEPPVVKITCEQKDDNWLFKVSDNGIGFNSKHTETVFVLFRQLNSKSKYAGTGIGLAHCKRIIELHNGKIWAETELGKGSDFYFTIPTKP